MESSPATPAERINTGSTPFIPTARHPEVDSGSLFASFSWPARDTEEPLPPVSQQPLKISDSRLSSRNVIPFTSSSESESSSPLENGWDKGLTVPSDLYGDGEETPVLPIFQHMEQSRANIPPLSTDSLVNGVGRSDIVAFRSSTVASPAPFQPSSAARSMPSPPLSSIGSDSFRSALESTSFEVQLKNSAIMGDLLDRLVRCETSTREVQRELGVVHHKVNILLEKTFASRENGEPEFNNPFVHGGSGIPQQSNSSPAARFSVAHTAVTDPPNQLNDLSQVTTRLNSLTDSVGQLLALQTQQYHLNLGGSMQTRHNPAASTPLEVAPKQVSGMHPMHGQSQLGHGLPPRVDLRGIPRTPGLPNAPMRTWSTGNLDISLRSPDNNSNRGDSGFRGGKRGSLAPVTRRDSTGPMDSSGENWGGGGNFAPTGSRESAQPTIKWESLPLAPELLHSLAKFGVGPPNKVQQRALPFLLKGADIIAQAPPTQERIAAYVIPAIHLALCASPDRPLRGPLVVMISTTVDQATQAQRMIRDLGGPIGIRSALGVGSYGPGGNIMQEVRNLQQNIPHILCGTPQKLHAIFTAPGGLSGSDVRLLVLDEVDQLIARNLHDFVLNIVKMLPSPRSTRPKDIILNSPASATPGSSIGADNSGSVGAPSFSTASRRFSSALQSPSLTESQLPTEPIERQTALFSNTVPQDVLNLANTIQLREPVRVLVRRDGNVTHSETGQGTRGLRQFYLYLAFTGGGRKDSSIASAPGGAGIIGSGRGTSNPETAQAREWKLEALSDLFDDLEVPQAIVHVGGMTALDTVVYKLANRGLEAISLHSDMNAAAKMAVLNKFRSSAPSGVRPPTTKILVVYDVPVKAPDVFQIPLVINYDLPKAVEEYAHRVAPAISSNYSRAGVVVNFVTATGGDVEMLRSIECFYKIKCPEVPVSLRELLL